MADQSPSFNTAPSLKLTHHRALIFDVYGTLIDWESAIFDAFSAVFPDKSREDILVSYAGVEGKLQMKFPSTPYSKILELAYRQLTTPGGVTTAGIGGEEARGDNQDASTSEITQEDTITPPPPIDDAQRFGASIADWKPFPDTIEALHRLKKHFALIVLSNVDDRSFARTHAKLCLSDYPGSAYPTITPDSPFSLVLTAQQVGAYKPDSSMLKSALRQLSANADPSLPLPSNSVRVDASKVLVVANSIRHDIIPSMQQELGNVWISRDGVNFIGNKDGGMIVHYSEHEGPAVDDVFPYTWRYETLGSMAGAVETEARSQ